ncbi:hypothetical protein C1H46_005989 [Malus baccata]|uniref:Uncharacterized protein n=1 Tax=Malus baccata TaxID=106549 RepID=A0A540NBE9_MALBA|nr:hypothetical protein C1H46_005989 [Malus baccata]
MCHRCITVCSAINAERFSSLELHLRVVNEVHNSVTKKNKEWQKKLPLVVLRAKEIMYSKANYEAEYMNLDTLWDRAHDAVNTIIQRDEGTETRELLPLCVEGNIVLISLQSVELNREIMLLIVLIFNVY